MKKIILLVSLLLLLVFGGLLIGPSFIDWEKYKPQIIAQIHDATGYDVALEGRINFALLPQPHLLAESVGVSVPVSGEKDPYQILSLDRVEVSVVLTDLLNKRLTVDRVQLLQPHIVLRTDRDGQPLWMPPAMAAMTPDEKTVGRAGAGLAAGAVAGSGVMDNIGLEKLSIKDGILVTQDASGQTLERVENIDLNLRAESLSGPFRGDGSLSYQGRDFSGTFDLDGIPSGDKFVSLVATIEVPKDKVGARYAGTLGLAGGLGLQGELSFDAKDLSSVVAQGASKRSLDVPLEIEGFLTLDKMSSLSIKDVKIVIDGSRLTGHVDVKNIETSQPKIDVALKGAEGLDASALLDALQSGGAQNDRASGAVKASTAAAAPALFMPDVISLPRDVEGQVALTIPSVRYEGTEFSSVDVLLSRSGSRIEGAVSAGMPGGGTVNLVPTLSFGASSVSQKDGVVTLSDPRLNIKAQGKLDRPADLKPILAAFGQDKAATPFLSDPMQFDLDLSITPRKAALTRGVVRVGTEAVSLSGQYALPQAGKRGALTANVEGQNIDLAAWQARLMPESAAASASSQGTAATGGGKGKTAAQDLEKTLSSLSLPVDVNVTAVLMASSFPTVGQGDLQLKGRMVGDALFIDMFDFKTAANDHLSVAGQVGALSSLSGIDVRTQAETPDMESLLATLKLGDKVSLPTRVGAGNVVAALKGKKDALGFTVNAKALRGSVEASGVASDLFAATPQLDDLTVRVRHPNYVDLVKLFQPDFSAVVNVRKDLDVYAQVKRTGKLYDISGLKAQVGPSAVSGSVQADMGAARPKITAALQMGDVPLDDLLGHQSSTKKGTISNATKSKTSPAASGEARWSRMALDTAWMRQYDLDVTARVSSLSYEGWAMSHADLAARLDNGVLNLDHLTGALYGGSLALSGKAKAGENERAPLTLSGKADLQNVALESFVKAFSGERLIKAQGSVSVNADLAASGLSPSALVHDLHGKGSASGQKLILEGFDLARLSRALAAPTSSFTENFGKLFDATMAGGSTSFDTLDSAFTVTEGVINFDKLALDGADATITGTGNVNLPLWTINLKTVVDLKAPEDAPSLETTFKGPLDNPGKTFAQNAMQQYFGKQLEGLIVNPLLENLQKKGILPGASSSQQQQTTPETSGETTGSSSTKFQKITPEDALFGVLQGVLGGQ